MKQLLCKELHCVKELIKLKFVLKYAAVVVNHGVKKELDVLVKGLSVLHNGAEVVLYSDQHHAATAYKLPKKVRRLAIKSALSSKVLEENMLVLDILAFDSPKTKDFKTVLSGLSVDKKALIVTADLDENVALSARNIPGVTVVTASGINVLRCC